MVWCMWITDVQLAVTARCMNEFMHRLLFVMQEEFHLSVFLASQGSGRANCKGRGGCMIWLVCEKGVKTAVFGTPKYALDSSSRHS